MKLEKFENQKLIEKFQPSQKQVVNNIQQALKDLDISRANLKINEEWAFTIAYHAMLRSGRALLFSYQYRPRGKNQHKTIVLICEEILGPKFKTLISRFDRMRRKRHEFIYQPQKPIAYSEALSSINDARKFVHHIYNHIKKRYPQIELNLG